MAQCERILETGDRCSNQAVPGTDRCNEHRRIVFSKVAEPAADTAPPPRQPQPPPPPAAAPPEPAPAPPEAIPGDHLRAVASAAAEQPLAPWLQPDERNLLVAPVAVIWLEADPESPPEARFTRFVRLLGLVSQAVDLPSRVRLQNRSEGGDWLVHLSFTEPEADAPALSVTYDAIASAARLTRAGFYIGDGSTYVQYRDNRAPRGYDLSGPVADDGQPGLLLVSRRGGYRLDPDDFFDVSLSNLVLRIAPVPERTSRPSEIWALAPACLHLMLARYLRHHRLSYRVAHLTAAPGDEVLLSVAPTEERGSVPAFIVDYLSRLPRVTLLAPVVREEKRTIMVEQGHRFPLHLPHVANAFAADSMVLLQANAERNLHVSPGPRLLDGDDLVTVNLHQPPAEHTPATQPLPGLELPVVLRRHSGPTPPTAALLLDQREIGWLRTLVYRLPGELFASYTLCLGEKRAVLLGGDRAIAGLPIGLPLQQFFAQGSLYIPLYRRLVPDLPWPLLQRALGIPEETVTVLTEDERIDLPTSAFAPLSRSLLADPRRQPVTVTLRRTTAPTLVWSAPPAPAIEVRGAAAADATPDQPATTPEAPGAATASEEPAGFTGYLRQEAGRYEQEGDPLAAAVCYNLASDAFNSARCYRRAAQLLAQGQGHGA